MQVVNALKEAGGSLVAPEGGEFLRSEVGEGAVAQLKQLVPLHGVVSPRLRTAEPDGVVHDVLRTDGQRHNVDPRWVRTWISSASVFAGLAVIGLQKCISFALMHFCKLWQTKSPSFYGGVRIQQQQCNR